VLVTLEPLEDVAEVEPPALEAEVDPDESEPVEVVSPLPLVEVIDMLELSETELVELVVETTPDEDVVDSSVELLAPVVVAAKADE